MRKQSSLSPAFTIVEILVVLAIVVFITAIAVPAATKFFLANDLATAGRLIEQSFTNARMLATTRGRRVEARLIRSNSDAQVRGIQLFIFDESGTTARPASAFRAMPNAITVNENTQNSTLWAALPNKTFTTNDPQVPVSGIGTAYTARAVLFLPNGGLALNPDQNWFITLHSNQSNWTVSTLPANFYCIQVDPVLGTIRTFRP